jgi:hypothetical protein
LADKLEVGTDQLNHGLDIAAIERLVETPQDSDHLLVSHCPPSISQGKSLACPQEGESMARIPTQDRASELGVGMRKAVAMILVAGTATALLAWVNASASPNDGDRQKKHMRLFVTDGWSVDNDPSGESGGDLFGASGDLRRRGHRTGKWSSACTLSPPVGGQCQVTLILRGRDRIQLAGNIRIQGDFNRLSIVGGTGKFRDVGGDATLQTLDDPQVQQLELTILR